MRHVECSKSREQASKYAARGYQLRAKKNFHSQKKSFQTLPQTTAASQRLVPLSAPKRCTRSQRLGSQSAETATKVGYRPLVSPKEGISVIAAGVRRVVRLFYRISILLLDGVSRG